MTYTALDELYSEYIRKRAMYLTHGCQRCLSWKNDWHELQAAHCFGRGNGTTRHDIRNGAGICGGCHLYIDTHEEAKFDFFRKLIGTIDLEKLYMLSNLTTKQYPIDYKAIEIFLKRGIKEFDKCLMPS